MESSTVTCYSYNNRQGMTLDTEKRSYWHLTLNEILAILCAAAIPIALGVYTAITYTHEQRQADRQRQFDLQQAAELRQEVIYDKFLSDMYKLAKDGYLDEEQNPWAFANAYHRSAHRQWDTVRKENILQFFKEKGLIGKIRSTTKRATEQLNDIIQLNELSFDNIHLESETDTLNLLNMKYISFDQVSLLNARFSFVNLDETSFDWARLNYVKFEDSSLAYASFDSTQLQQTDFGNSNLTGTRFSNVNLTTAKLTNEQIQQAIFLNTILSNGTLVGATTTATPLTTTTESTVVTTNQTTIPPYAIELTSDRNSVLSTNEAVNDDITTDNITRTTNFHPPIDPTSHTTTISPITAKVSMSDSIDEITTPSDETQILETSSISP